MEKISFKPYSPKQLMLLPPDLSELVPLDSPARIVDRIIEQIDLTLLYQTYTGGGASSYDPQMLLKVLIYAYIQNIYSSRKIEKALKDSVSFMWLSAQNKPDHNTINRFRSEHLKDVIKPIFSQVVKLLLSEGVISIKEAFIDGTKIEANANKYSFVWGKAIKTNKTKIEKQLEDIWRYVEDVTHNDSKQLTKPDIKAIDSKKVNEAIEKINEALQEKQIDPKIKQKLNYAKKNWGKALDKYEDYEKKLGSRNSFSKTDPDATFMRLKDDHMQNGQLKAAYNLQISTNKQFILSYSLEQKSTDTTTLINHLEGFKGTAGAYPEIVTADAGYGSEENYEYLESQGIEGYVKYNMFHKEQKKSHLNNIFHVENLYYNEEKDVYYCPMGQALRPIGNKKRTTTTGYVQKLTLYQAIRCQGCPLRSGCHKAKGNRIIEVNHNLKRHKEKAKELLLSEKGIRKRGQRCADVEATFGLLKQNKNFKRFMLRGLPKVELETGLVALAHNLSKLVA